MQAAASGPGCTLRPQQCVGGSMHVHAGFSRVKTAKTSRSKSSPGLHVPPADWLDHETFLSIHVMHAPGKSRDGHSQGAKV